MDYKNVLVLLLPRPCHTTMHLDIHKFTPSAPSERPVIYPMIPLLYRFNSMLLSWDDLDLP